MNKLNTYDNFISLNNLNNYNNSLSNNKTNNFNSGFKHIKLMNNTNYLNNKKYSNNNSYLLNKIKDKNKISYNNEDLNNLLLNSNNYSILPKIQTTKEANKNALLLNSNDNFDNYMYNLLEKKSNKQIHSNAIINEFNYDLDILSTNKKLNRNSFNIQDNIVNKNELKHSIDYKLYKANPENKTIKSKKNTFNIDIDNSNAKTNSINIQKYKKVNIKQSGNNTIHKRALSNFKKDNTSYYKLNNNFTNANNNFKTKKIKNASSKTNKLSFKNSKSRLSFKSELDDNDVIFNKVLEELNITRRKNVISTNELNETNSKVLKDSINLTSKKKLNKIISKTNNLNLNNIDKKHRKYNFKTHYNFNNSPNGNYKKVKFTNSSKVVVNKNSKNCYDNIKNRIFSANDLFKNVLDIKNNNYNFYFEKSMLKHANHKLTSNNLSSNHFIKNINKDIIKSKENLNHSKYVDTNTSNCKSIKPDKENKYSKAANKINSKMLEELDSLNSSTTSNNLKKELKINISNFNKNSNKDYNKDLIDDKTYKKNNSNTCEINLSNLDNFSFNNSIGSTRKNIKISKNKKIESLSLDLSKEINNSLVKYHSNKVIIDNYNVLSSNNSKSILKEINDCKKLVLLDNLEKKSMCNNVNNNDINVKSECKIYKNEQSKFTDKEIKNNNNKKNTLNNKQSSKKKKKKYIIGCLPKCF